MGLKIFIAYAYGVLIMVEMNVPNMCRRKWVLFPMLYMKIYRCLFGMRYVLVISIVWLIYNGNKSIDPRIRGIIRYSRANRYPQTVQLQLQEHILFQE